jgi:membrane protein DedA with SNARE-associated domain
MGVLTALAAATLLSEDGALVLAGVLVAQGVVSPVEAIAAGGLGVYIGDLLLFVAGRLLGARVLGWPRVSRALGPTRLRHLHAATGRHLGMAIFGSRFIPGSRLPLYVAAGALGGSASVFAWWSAIAVAVWTPLIVFASAGVLPSWSALQSWPARAAAVLLLAAALRTVHNLLQGRYLKARIAATVSRAWRWEFWPMWLFYAPVAAWIVFLIVRHRGVGVIAAANPGMPDGGIVGESKSEILSRLPQEWTIPWVRIDAAPIESRTWRMAQAVSQLGWQFPLVCKPDVGQRGAGVKLVRSLEDARRYLEREPGAILLQPYHTGPYEAGVFYYRMPGWTHGRILSITDKRFPAVVGDGCSTIRDLIWSDPRLRMQAPTFLARHASELDQVPPAGHRIALAMAGNHCQGTLFRDGEHLITPDLERRIDAIARSYRGFFIGRFDIRYTDVDRFKSGEDLAIVELNGATAESTNIYDPKSSLLAAYRQLFRQWSLVFAIGAANRADGAPTASVQRLLDLLRAHLSSRPAFTTSD